MNQHEHIEGSCHCGDTAFEVTGAIPTELTECNCSLCSRKGSRLWFVPKARFRLLSPEANLATYTFNNHRIQHHFCPNCGIHTYGEADDGKDQAMIAINVRCLDNFDTESLPVRHFDGRSI